MTSYYAESGSNKCDGTVITSESDCQAAASYLGLKWDGDRSWSDRYKGCTRDNSGTDVNFNTKGDGSSKMGVSGGQVAICNR